MALPNPNPGGAAGAGAGAATIDGFDNLVDMTGDQKDQLVNLNKGFDKLLRTQEKMLSVLLKAFGGPKVDPDEQRELKDTAGGEKGKDLDLKKILEGAGGFGTIFGAALVAYALGLDKYIRSVFAAKVIFKGVGAAFKAVFGAKFITDFLKNLKPVKDFMNGFKNVGKVIGAVKAPVAIKEFTTIFGKIGATVGSIVKTIGSAFDAVKRFVKPIGSIFSTIGGFFRSIFSALGPILKTAGNFLKAVPIVGQIIMILFSVFDFIKGFITGFASKGEKDSRGMLERVFDGMVNGAVEVIRGILIIPLDLLKSGFSWLMGKLGFTELEKTLDSFSFNEMYNKFIEAYKNFFSTEPAEGYFSIVRFLLDGVENGVAFVKSGIEGAGDMASKAFDAIVKFGKNLFALEPEEGEFSIVKFIMDKVQNIKDTIKGFFGGGDDAGGGGGFDLSSIFGDMDFSFLDPTAILSKIGEKVNAAFQSFAKIASEVPIVGEYLGGALANAGVGIGEFLGAENIQKFNVDTKQMDTLKEAAPSGANGGGGQGTAAGEMSKEVAAKKEAPPPAAIDASTKTGDTVTNNNSKTEMATGKVAARSTDNPGAGNRQKARRGR